MDEQLRRACIAYNSVLLHQPEDCRDQTAAMHAAIAPLLSRLSAAEARVGVLAGLIRQMHDEYQADEQCDYVKINAYIEALHAALTQAPSHEPE